MKTEPNTLDRLINYYEDSSTDSHFISPGINDFNNVEKADRKIIINNQLEFWLSDKVLNDNCNYFLTEKINENIINNNKEKKVEYTIINKNNNINLKKSVILIKKNKFQNKKFKLDIQLPNNKEYNFAKYNSKNIRLSNINRNYPYKNYNTYNTISSEQDSLINNNSAIIKDKIKKKIASQIKRNCSYLTNRRNINPLLNKSYITDDKIKLKRIKDIIKRRKIALGLIDNNSNKTPDRYINNINKQSTNHYPLLKHIKKNTSEGEHIYYKNNLLFNNRNNFINKNLINKTYIHRIRNNKIFLNKRNKIYMTNNNNVNKTIMNYRTIDNNNDNNKSHIQFKNNNNTSIKQTRINISDKNEYYLIFDVLVWMYTKDIKKLKKYIKNSENLLHILSLAKFLKLKKKFYNALLTAYENHFEKGFFDSLKWTKNKISFYALEKIIPLINGNYNRIYALISWLKPINNKTNKISYDETIIEEIIKSKEFFLVRNYIKKYKLIYSLARDEIIDLKNKFYYFIDCLDMDGIFNNYILSKNELKCILCNNNYNSIYEIMNETDENYNVNNNIYYPPKILNGQYKLNDYKDFNKSFNRPNNLLKSDDDN